MSQRKGKARRARAAAERPSPSPALRDAGGRVHLVLLRGPDGREQVALRTPVFTEDWQNELAIGTANTARAILGDKPNLERTLELGLHAVTAASRLTSGLLARAPEGAVKCKAGCDHCCYQVVGATVPEALTVLDHLLRTRTPEELERVIAEVAEARARNAGLSSLERFSPEHPCPFLHAGQCSIYEVRPLACRGMNSLDADACATRLRDPATREQFVRGGQGGSSFMEPIRAAYAISAGLQLTLSELYELDGRPLDLTAAMHILLQAPAAATKDWLAGRTPFESAAPNTSEEDAGLRALSGTLVRGTDPNAE